MITEEWLIQVGKNKHTISGEEMKIIVNAGETRFVRFRDLVVNPAFVADMVFLRKINNSQLDAGEKVDVKPTIEQEERTEKVKKEIREKLKRF
jgi:GH25 family lysozyme M1 (1,4-beta-N-acetylmuramidase)